MSHDSHPEVLKRLRRAHGHLATVIGMIEKGSPCLQLAQQLHAVESAIHQAKKVLIHDHIDNCLDEAQHKSHGKRHGRAHGSLSEFKNITKYL